ncbi:MAG: lipolytic protein family [Candidatus Doudnabacteria bacterium]|nr:lipolytic protein family [Candidatus Doudnabacteria bacterium]
MQKQLRNKKMIFWLIVLLVLGYATFTYLRFEYILKHANLADIQQKDLTFGQGSVLRYIAAGDSTAVGEGASKVENSYTYKLALNLSAEHTVQYKNIAVIGAKTQDVIDHQLSEIIKYNPDVVTVSINANDLTHFVSGNIILKNDQLIIDTILKNTHAKIYITDVPGLQNAKIIPWWFRHLLDWKANSLNKKILTFQDKYEGNRVKIVDIHNFGWDTYHDIQKTFAADQFHPSDLGYQNWTNAFLDKMLKKD